MTADFRPDTYWQERLRSHFDEKGVGDIGLSRSFNAWLYAVRRRVFQRCLTRMSLKPAQCRVLDVGAGTGFYVNEWIRQRASSVTAIDISSTAVTRLRERFPFVSFYQADVSDPGLSRVVGNNYDVVSVFDVLFHVVDDRAYHSALSNISRVLRPGGWFLYSDNLVRTEVRLPHYVSRKESFVVKSVLMSGFEIVHRIPSFVLMNNPTRTNSRVLRAWYSYLHRIAGRNEFAGMILGAGLFPIELVLTGLIRSAPGTQVLLCRKRRAPTSVRA